MSEGATDRPTYGPADYTTYEVTAVRTIEQRVQVMARNEAEALAATEDLTYDEWGKQDLIDTDIIVMRVME